MPGTETQIIPSLAAGATGQVSWEVEALSPGTHTYSVTVNALEATASRSVVVPENSPVTLVISKSITNAPAGSGDTSFGVTVSRYVYETVYETFNGTISVNSPWVVSNDHELLPGTYLIRESGSMPARYSRDGYSVGDYAYSGDEYWVDLAIDDILEITFINRYRRPYSPPPEDEEPPKIVVDEEPEAEPEEEEEVEIIEEIPEEVSIGDEVIDIVTDTPAVTEEELPKTGADILLALLGMALAGSGIAARRKRKR